MRSFSALYFGVRFDLFWALWIPAVLCLLWFFLDCKAWVRFVKRHHLLNHEGRWDDLEALHQKELRAFRPFVRLLIRFKSPGGLEVLIAGLLYQKGRAEEALRSAESAAAKSRGHATNHSEALSLQALSLLELGRYEELRDVAARIRSLGVTHVADFNEALLCLFLGRLDPALSLAQQVIRHPKGDLGRGLLSAILLSKGDHAAALETLLDPPRPVSAYYSPENLRKLERSSDGRAMVEAHQKQWAGVAEPLRFLQAGYLYLDLGDVEGLRFTLEKAGGVLGGNPTLNIIHRELNACLCASTGDAAGAERWLQQGAELLKTHPRRLSQMEFRRFGGRANLLLGRPAAALADFEASLELTRHPMEKHIARYWLARAQEAKGNKEKAAELYRAVVADGIASKYSVEAAKASPP
jgi:tetratricopeptide (TPR) repeat protein